MDLQVTSHTLATRDYSWLASQIGLAGATTETMLISGATKATHYPNGFIKSGTIIARYTSGGNEGLIAPHVHNGSTGLETQIGVVLDGFEVRYDEDGVVIGTKTAGSILLGGLPVMVYVAKLPGLLNAAAAAYAPVAADLPTGFIAVTN